MSDQGDLRARLLFALTSGMVLTACAAPGADFTESGHDTTSSPSPSAQPGALIRLEMGSRVGVLLDEIPEGPLRETAAFEASHRGADFWTRRAKMQARLMTYRLVFRSGFYPSDPPRGPLPLPAQDELWTVHFGALPHREKKDGHDAVVVDYRLETFILSPADSPATVEPELAGVGGSFEEPFVFPLDPDLLMERTGYACMNEMEYPPFSVFEESTSYFYDHTCEAETASAARCHVTSFPVESCVDALAARAGKVETKLRFSRIPYSRALADRVRRGARTTEVGADLSVVTEDMEREHAVFYRYFSPSSCELAEGVIGAAGWRRLLGFSATIQNDGAAEIDMGNLADPANPWVKSHVLEYSDCHHHYHFSHYGSFAYGAAPGTKRAFCVEDTNRYHNDERTPLWPGHMSCQLQGITPGWGDEYQIGISGQWIDITGVDTSAGHVLTFDVNPDHFLCEGMPTLDASGALVFEPTSFTGADGEAVSRQACTRLNGWQSNNHGSTWIQPSVGSFVTEPCARGQIGPLRSCGFDPDEALLNCDAGGPVTLHCESAGSPQVVRVCERSHVLGSGVACTVGDSIANSIVPSGGVDLTFQCPSVRDAAAGAGGFSIYRAPVLPGQAPAQISCVVQ